MERTYSMHGRDIHTKFWYENLKERYHKRRWENDIKTSIQNIGMESVDWINLAQDRDQWQALVK
jgi:hypothetical protein